MEEESNGEEACFSDQQHPKFRERLSLKLSSILCFKFYLKMY